jgi:hypothetical protein
VSRCHRASDVETACAVSAFVKEEKRLAGEDRIGRPVVAR